MDTNKSSDAVKSIIASVLRDVQTLRNDVITPRSLKLTTLKVFNRIDREGICFLTKTLPRLGKAFGNALHNDIPMDCTGFRKIPGTKLPRFLGELFQLVLSQDGKVLPTPCVTSIRQIRQILYLFYKYELPYSTEQEQNVISQFVKTESEIRHYHETFTQIADLLGTALNKGCHPTDRQQEETITDNIDYCIDDRLLDRKNSYSEILSFIQPSSIRLVIRKARKLLSQVFANFDPSDIVPCHGPGAVSTREKLWDKYTFSSVSERVATLYPLDAYFYASLGHVCDELDSLSAIKLSEVPAKVILVPKDSRGPRLISCEPLAMQWIQQGLGRGIMQLVESHPLTRWNVNFTNQQPNQFGALLGSRTGKYSTLDLKEASDRVTVGLVRCLFPSHMLPYLMAARSLSTTLPDGSILNLNKFAPMGSALCFPILALTVWAILSASCEDADTRESILVYGDDVIVKTDNALYAIERLEAFGLLVNRDKSCFRGFFRESCGVDAYKGINVTPLRLRTVWTSTQSPSVYSSWIAYANQFFDNGYYTTFEVISQLLFKQFGSIPHDGLNIECPSLREVPSEWQVRRKRVNEGLQKTEYFTRDLALRPIKKTIAGWKMLLRYFTEGHRHSTMELLGRSKSDRADARPFPPAWNHIYDSQPFSASSYTKRGTVRLVRRWR